MTKKGRLRRAWRRWAQRAKSDPLIGGLITSALLEAVGYNGLKTPREQVKDDRQDWVRNIRPNLKQFKLNGCTGPFVFPPVDYVEMTVVFDLEESGDESPV